MTNYDYGDKFAIPRLSTTVVLYGRSADVVRTTALMESRTQQDVIRQLIASVVEAPMRRPDLNRVRIEALVDADRTTRQIADQLGLTVVYVRAVRSRIRKEREQS
jgi:hypothetical protein